MCDQDYHEHPVGKNKLLYTKITDSKLFKRSFEMTTAFSPGEAVVLVVSEISLKR